MNVRVADADGKELIMSRDFAAIRAEYAEQSPPCFPPLHPTVWKREGLTRDFEDLPETGELREEPCATMVFPALTDDGASVSIKDFRRQNRPPPHREGLARLAMLQNHEQARFLIKGRSGSPVAAFQRLRALLFRTTQEPHAGRHAPWQRKPDSLSLHSWPHSWTIV